jgi:hypothetical protein
VWSFSSGSTFIEDGVKILHAQLPVLYPIDCRPFCTTLQLSRPRLQLVRNPLRAYAFGPHDENLRSVLVVKAILLLLSGIVFAVMVFLSGVAVTAFLIAEPEPHHFANVEHPDLWTSKPVVVSGGEQRYERIAAVTAEVDLPASDAEGQPIVSQEPAADEIDGVATAALDQTGETALEDPISGSEINQAHADWCFARYRSYRIEDNTYQPYSGGQRRSCESPIGMSGGETTVSVDGDGQMEDQALAQQVSATSTMIGRGQDGRLVREIDRSSAPQNASYDGMSMGNAAHEEWCQSRYRSYRADDNSYQPYGGMRRTCQSPFG